MSTHAIEIIEIGEITPHPNADNLQITHAFGWQCCIGKEQFRSGDKAVYIPPDYLVPVAHPSFSFLKRDVSKAQERIRVRRLRGELSQGLLIALPQELASLPVGTDVSEQLRIERYEPPLPKTTGGMFVPGPSGLYSPKFDVENYQRYPHLFKHGEPVVVTEKIHGASARYTWAQNKDGEWMQFCGSRTNWMAEDEKNIYWMAFKQNAGIGQWCHTNRGKILYGEVFGQVQSLKYGARKNEIFFAAFAILDRQRWLDWWEYIDSVTPYFDLDHAPVVYEGSFDKDYILPEAEGSSLWHRLEAAEQMREGIVILPIHERRDEEIGRVILKVVSNRYLEKGK